MRTVGLAEAKALLEALAVLNEMVAVQGRPLSQQQTAVAIRGLAITCGGWCDRPGDAEFALHPVAPRSGLSRWLLLSQ